MISSLLSLLALSASPIAPIAESSNRYEEPVDDIVARLTIHAYQTVGSTPGHCFLSVKNKTSSSLSVGHLTLYGGQSLSVGTWDNNWHTGLFYNYENYDNGGWKNANCARVSIDITDIELLSLSAQLQNPSNNSYSNTNTCASFASRVWNVLATSSMQITNSHWPDDIYDSIMLKSGHSTSSLIPSNSNVGYVQGSSFISI